MFIRNQRWGGLVQLTTLFSMTTSGQLAAASGVARLASPLYWACWLAAAGRAGVLAALAAGPLTLEALAQHLGAGAEGHEALRSWLGVGLALGELACSGDTWRLRSAQSRRLAQPQHDAALALLEELVGLHTLLLLETPDRLRQRRPFQLADQDGEVIARSSRIVEPVIHEQVRAAVQGRGPLRLLEVGCCPRAAAEARWPGGCSTSGVQRRRGAGRLPDPGELVAQLGEAGYSAATSQRLFPGEALIAFTATNPG